MLSINPSRVAVVDGVVGRCVRLNGLLRQSVGSAVWPSTRRVRLASQALPAHHGVAPAPTDGGMPYLRLRPHALHPSATSPKKCNSCFDHLLLWSLSANPARDKRRGGSHEQPRRSI